MNQLIIGLKIGGTFSLGLLTGTHLNFSLNTIKSIISVASAPHAQRAFITSLGLLRSTVRPLEIIATASLITSWILSPRYGRHPYLWIASTPIFISIAIEKCKLAGVETGVLSTQTVLSHPITKRSNMEAEINGEVVNENLECWGKWGLLRGGIIGTGFVISLIGLYGDRYS
ncbi:hypothetical protein EDC01DRAFT_713648 [Geopyxis carbonaria]|nr:hypothetical protein EDC01DRAFT_713648 [Geopyxis carbonaria]